MLYYILGVIAGLLLLVWGADRFILGAAATARNFGVAPMVIGLTVVGIGTSAPEIFVSAAAAVRDSTGLAIGNAMGSNIANVGLVLGVTAVVRPLAVRSQTLKREFPMMFAVIILAGVLLFDEVLDRWDGVILLAAFVMLVASMVAVGRHARGSDPLSEEFAQEIPARLSPILAAAWLVLGLIVLIIGARLIVWGAANIASELGVSDLVIGLTVVAVGTSLPELAASVTSVLKEEPDIAIGNVIGSNMFNLLPVLGLPGLIAPGAVPSEAFSRDYVVMSLMSVALLIMAFATRSPSRIGRLEGGALFLAFCAYQVTLYLTTN